MRFFSSNKTLPVLVVLCYISLIFGNATLNTKKNAKMTPRRKTLVALLFTSNASFFSPELETKGLCRWLKGLKHQRKLCQNKKGLPALLQETRRWTLNACRKQFEYDHWNCSDANMRKFFKKMYRETAFMYSLATSAFMYIVSRACAEGRLANCKCASPGKSDNMTDWQWGGCGYNTKFATKFTKKFLQLRKTGDNLGNIMNYNSEVGIKVVQKHEERHCKCHGLSGSCSLNICWKRLRPFDEIAHNLKQLYHRAIQIEPDNNLHELNVHKKKKNLVFLDNSPNYCDPNGISSGVTTVGRRCRDIDNCATLCCSRGYEVSYFTAFDKCHCKWLNDSSYILKCDQCAREETHLNCK